MSFTTPFHPENTPGPIYEFAWHKLQRHTKTALVNMIGNFFSSRVQLYSMQMPEIIGLRNYDDIKNIFINQDFPYSERKLPLIVVGIKGGKEKKMYLGADNLLYYDVRPTSTGRTATEVYAGAATFTVALIALGQSPEERMKLTENLFMCFTHYFRWQYFYTTGNGDMFSIVPNTKELEFGTEQEADGEDKIAQIYVNDLTMNSFVEYSFRGVDTLFEATRIAIEEDSGPIIYGVNS